MKKKRLLMGLLCAGMIAGCAVPMMTAEAGELHILENVSEEARAVSVITEDMVLSRDLVYDSLTIEKSVDLNGHVLRVNGDLVIAGNVNLNKGVLVVSGNVLHPAGYVNIGTGSMEVTGDYRIQDTKTTSGGGKEYIESDGNLSMTDASARLKVGGNFVMQSKSVFNNFTNGIMEIGGDVIQKNGHARNFICGENHRVMLTGTKQHKIEIESAESKFNSLDVESGQLTWNGYMSVGSMLSDISAGPGNGKELILNGINLNERKLSIRSDVKIAANVSLNGGIMQVTGNVLHPAGSVNIGTGSMEVTGDYRIQDTKTTSGGGKEYIESDGTLSMTDAGARLKVGRNFIIQSKSVFNNFTNGIMEIGGDVIQKNGHARNFICGENHRVILTGTNPQKVEIESADCGFQYLKLTRSLSNYSFNPYPCWKVLEGVEGEEYTYNNVVYKVLTFTGTEGTVEAVSAANKSITNASIPNTVQIGNYSFKAVSVKSSAFAGCSKLKTVKLGKNVTAVGKKAFYGCTALTSVNIPASVTKLEDSTFSGCKKLKAVGGCSGITTIGSKVFYKCEKLVTIGSKNGAITMSKVKTIGNSAFYGCKAVKKVNLTSTVLTKIGDSAFQGCTSVTSFTSKSQKLTTIGKKAFYGDKKLGTISLKTEKLKKSKVGSNAFKGMKSTCKFKVPKKQVSTYKAIFKAKGAGKKFTVSKL